MGVIIQGKVDKNTINLLNEFDSTIFESISVQNMDSKIHINPVFHNNKIFFVKRKDFVEVRETITKYYNGLYAKVINIRPLACHSNKDLSNAIVYMNIELNNEFVNSERIERN